MIEHNGECHAIAWHVDRDRESDMNIVRRPYEMTEEKDLSRSAAYARAFEERLKLRLTIISS